MPRLFTGLEVPPEIAEQLSMIRGGLVGARWIDSENYHVTLRFMGDIDYGSARDVSALLGHVRRAPLKLTIDGLDIFGGDKPRALVARIAPTQQLIELQAEHERLVRRAGLPPERRKFTPHVTLARLRDTSPWDAADFLTSRARAGSKSFTADRFVLFSSRASVGGGPYVVEAAYPLRRPGFTAAAGAPSSP
jgi:2'-5' RNA ligase